MSRAKQTSFSMKLFRVDQEKAAMKVCTEACLFGGMIDPSSAKRILDVGTGTGLLALMLAQRSDAAIEAIDLDPDSVDQARANFERSPFAARLVAIQGDFREWHPNALYDLIVSNPPFFSGTIPAGGVGRQRARHSDTLPLETLCQRSSQWLTPGGSLALLLPNDQVEPCLRFAAEWELAPQQITRMRHTAEHPPNCAVAIFKKSFNFNMLQHLPDSTQDIKEPTGRELSAWSRAILSPYYLRIQAPAPL